MTAPLPRQHLDGEMRRALFENSLYEGIDGISPNPRKPEFTDASADPSGSEVGSESRRQPAVFIARTHAAPFP